jgi:hypothetical protein
MIRRPASDAIARGAFHGGLNYTFARTAATANNAANQNCFKPVLNPANRVQSSRNNVSGFFGGRCE